VPPPHIRLKTCARNIHKNLTAVWRAGHRAQPLSTSSSDGALVGHAGADGRVPVEATLPLVVARTVPISQRGLRARQPVFYFSQLQRSSSALVLVDERPISQRKPARVNSSAAVAVVHPPPHPRRGRQTAAIQKRPRNSRGRPRKPLGPQLDGLPEQWWLGPWYSSLRCISAPILPRRHPLTAAFASCEGCGRCTGLNAFGERWGASSTAARVRQGGLRPPCQLCVCGEGGGGWVGVGGRAQGAGAGAGVGGW
jgi:hypothetical protein